MSNESSWAFGDEWSCLGLFIIFPAATGGLVRCIMGCLFVSWSGFGYSLFQGSVRANVGSLLACNISERCCRVNQMAILPSLLERMFYVSFACGLAGESTKSRSLGEE